MGWRCLSTSSATRSLIHRIAGASERKGQKMNPRLRFTALAAALALGIVVTISPPASADRGGGGHGYYGHRSYGHGYYGRGYYGGRAYYPRFGFYFGSAYPYYPFGYPYPYWGPAYPYYPPAVVAVPSSPPVYIEKGGSGNDAAAQNDTQAYWYFCAGSNAYYPYVKQCPGGWERQVPMPPPDAR
jgi:hypothetical protein